ncbi:MAG: TonB-dependent receptor [Deltaproteobacteria bacterium]|jgi:vitamin B12 transporter|nr:TonB-dependent receptor [Deltaproteobacteria bacterium]
MTGDRYKLLFIFLAISILVLAQTAWAQQDGDTLLAQSGSLSTLVVTASSIEEEAREVTSNITVITAEEIAMSPAQDLAGLLAKHGFQTYQNGGSSSLYIRGIGASSMTNEMETPVVILLNGHRIGSPDLSFHLLGNVERIEVIRGPAAIQYGTSVAGVVNIITKKGQKGLFTTTLQAGVGSFGLIDQSFAFTGETNGFDFSFGAYHAKRDEYKIGGNGEKWLRTDYDNKLGFDLDAGYTFLDNHRLGVNFFYSKIDNSRLPGGGFLDTVTYPDNFGIYNNYLYNTTLSYIGSTNDKVFSWLAEYTFGKNLNKGDFYVDSYAPYYPDINSSYHSKMKLNEAKFQITFNKEIISLTSGIDYIQYNYETKTIYYQPTIHDSQNYRIKDIGVYLLGKLKLLDERLIFSLGGRYDSFDSSSDTNTATRTANNFAPSSGVALMVTDFLKLRANYSEGFITPSPTQLLGDNNWYISNLDLKNEKSKNFEIGADLAWNYIDVNFTYFHTDRINRIVSGPVAGGSYQFYNLDKKSTLAGLEAGLKFDIGRMLDQNFAISPYGNITWITTRKHREDVALVPQAPHTLPDVPRIMANYGLEFDHPGIGLSALLNLNYIGQSYTQNRIYMVPHNRTRFLEFGGFTVVDLSVKTRLWDTGDKGKFYAKAELNNIFDEDYAYVMDYPMPGRNFYLALGYEY